VPSSSPPEAVTAVGAQQPPPPAVSSPEAGAEPRTIVVDFLQNNASFDAHHPAARAFLTPEANNRWADTTVTIVDDQVVSNATAQEHGVEQVVVTGDLIGSIDPNGIYTPKQTVGGGGTPTSVTYTLRQVKGQWRIDNVQPGGVGLLISYSQFTDYYTQRTLYFYDQDDAHLVPDPRFSSIADSTDLASWLMTELAQGARAELQPATSTELPQQSDPRRVTVTPTSGVLKVEIPGSGSSQLSDATKGRLAAQIAVTLSRALGGQDFTITDGGRPVEIPQVHNTVFSAASFLSLTSPVTVVPTLYYINTAGEVIDASTDEPIAGPLGVGAAYKLASVGLATLSSTTTDRLLAAGTVGAPGAQTFYIGTTTDGLHQVAGISGALSRPAWVPYRDEVWIGAGTTLFRTATSGAEAGVALPVQISTGSDKVSLPIEALRFSPEGARVALVLKSVDGDGQIWIGSVVRTSESVQINDLKQISPAGVSITDVAWTAPLKLFAVGRNLSGSANVYELQSDGSLWTPKGIPNLPAQPDSITVSSGVPAAVSAATSIWVQRAGTWGSPPAGTTHGTNPIYVE
jgi:hypothetical protein